MRLSTPVLSSFLGGAPTAHWLARKCEAQLSAITTDVMLWDFVTWCRDTFTVQHCAQVACCNLQNFKQTSTVAEYVSNINQFECAELAGKETSEEQKVWAWYTGLKLDVLNKTEWDLISNYGLATLQDAQFAALVFDEFYTHTGFAGNTTGNILTSPSSSQRNRGCEDASSSHRAMPWRWTTAPSDCHWIAGPVFKATKQPHGTVRLSLAGTAKSPELLTLCGVCWPTWEKTC